MHFIQAKREETS